VSVCELLWCEPLRFAFIVEARTHKIEQTT